MSRAEWESTASPIDATWVASGLRARILFPLAVALLVLFSCFTAIGLAGRAAIIEREAERNAQSLAAVLDNRTHHEVASVQSIMERVMADARLQEAFAERDVAKLMQIAAPIHEAGSRRNGISHFYFILPDHTALLRVHNPGHRGDRIERVSLREAERTGAPAWLNEQGATGGFTLRVVYPWRVDGKLLGYLELGVEYSHVLDDIRRALGVELLIAVDKSNIDHAHWADAQKRAGRTDRWDEFPGAVLVARTLLELPPQVRSHIASMGGANHGPRANFEVRTRDRAYQVLARPFVVRGTRFGEIVMLQDITATVTERHLTVAAIVALFALVGGALFALLHVLLGRAENDVRVRTHRLEETQRRLSLEQHERVRTEQALERQQERNELLEARSRLVEQLRAAHDKAQDALRENEAVTADLRETQAQLVKAAREAGRAEIATNVLHNVGNVLSSVNVSAELLTATLRGSRLPGMTRALEMMDARAADLGDYLSQDEKGRLLPAYLRAVNEALAGEQQAMACELVRLSNSIDHIKDIVATQQSHASSVQVVEPVSPTSLAEEALRMQGSALARHQVMVVREYGEVPVLPLDRGRVLQILINLISNAKAAMNGMAGQEARLTLRVEVVADELRFSVQDVGEGIAKENLTRIFSHGFTTRTTGHGFGLHSSALAATEMGATLSVHSDGPQRGATFTLALPLAAISLPAPLAEDLAC